MTKEIILPDDEKQDKKKLKYPRSIFFIISNEFCERFCYYGMKTVLALYFTSVLRYDDDTSTVWYHVFNMLCYFFPLIGAIIADSFWGKYKTIVNLSILYSIGNIVLATSAVSILNLPQRLLTFVGLLFIAIGTGGIKPCICPFGGDQFVLPQQERQLERYFSVFYFSINAGSLISTALTPILREDVRCFGENTCFPLAFGIPGLLMIVSVFVFIAGTPLYKRKKPEGNIIVTVITCISNAIRNRIFHSDNVPRKEHWLDYADNRFSNEQISDIKAVFNVLFLFLPVPLFWALFDQQGSRWTFQAVHMDGRFLGGYNIKPDQMQVLNPLLILSFIPLFETCFYPVLRKVGIRRALQKMTLGGILAAVAFIMSAILEFSLEKTYAILPNEGNGQIRLFNALNCDVHLNPGFNETTQIIPALSSYQILQFPIQGNDSYKLHTKISVNSSCPFQLNSLETDILVNPGQAVSDVISQTNKDIALIAAGSADNLDKDTNGLTKLRVFFKSDQKESAVIELKQGLVHEKNTLKNNQLSNFFSIPFGSFKLYVNGSAVNASVNFEPGSIVTLLISDNLNDVKVAVIDMVPANSVPILWQLPQIITISAGEILFSVTGLEFSFTQAPSSMKSVLASAWLLTVAFGNLIVVIVSEIKIFRSQAYEFLLFAGLMLLDMAIFVVMAVKYKYVDFSNTNQNAAKQVADASSSVTKEDTAL